MTSAQLNELIVRSEQIGEGFRLPLLRAAAGGKIALVIAAHGGVIPRRALHTGRPTTIVLTDDHPGATGPSAWPQAPRLLRWAKHVMLHATGGTAEHYAFVVAATLAGGRTLLVEMEQRQHSAWLELIKPQAHRLRVLSIVPPSGGSHPVAGLPAGSVTQ